MRLLKFWPAPSLAHLVAHLGTQKVQQSSKENRNVIRLIPVTPRKKAAFERPVEELFWLRGEDLNLRPLGYEPTRVLPSLSCSII